MEVQVHTDHHVGGREDLISFIGFEVVAGLGPCADRVMSAHVHLGAARVVPTGRAVLERMFDRMDSRRPGAETIRRPA